MTSGEGGNAACGLAFRSPRRASLVVFDELNHPLVFAAGVLCCDHRQMETRMVELSQLVGLFAGKLLEQQDVVEDILDSAVGTAINVEQV